MSLTRVRPLGEEAIKRNCEACRRPFETWPGSLVKLCQREECRQHRRAAKRELTMKEREERERLDALRRDDRVKVLWKSVLYVIEMAATLDAPDRKDLARYVKEVGRARGAKGMRVALLNLAALALRWGGSLPERNIEVDPRPEELR